MKRSFFNNLKSPPRLRGLQTVSGLALAAALTACTPRSSDETPSHRAETDWTATPVIQSATRTAAGLRLEGVTDPQGRVVLRGRDGPAYATGSDDRGRFAMTVEPQAADVLFVVEAQRGETATPAPYDLLVARDSSGPIVLTAQGAPTLRLDPSGALDAIDSDGHALMASGRAPPRSEVAIRVEDRAPIRAVSGADGRWSAMLMSDGARALTLTVGDQTYAYPGPGAAPGRGEAADRAALLASFGTGWRAAWSLGPQAWRSSWFPARAR